MQKIKGLFKSIVIKVLYNQLDRLVKDKPAKVIAVVGAYGKTSTKLSIASVLKEKFKVRYQTGNYNDIVTIPLIYFDRTLPPLYNPLSWLALFINNELSIRHGFDYDVVVLELGTDAPGSIAEFGKYLSVDIAVVSSIAIEHMQFFASLDDVASEELEVAHYSKEIIYNYDLCESKYFKSLKLPLSSYGFNNSADYKIDKALFDGATAKLKVSKGKSDVISLTLPAFSNTQFYSAAAAVTLADKLNVDKNLITIGLNNIKPVPGRMQLLKALNGSLIIDDTYNASPNAVIAALDVLYSLSAKHKIAVIGNMNELGSFSEVSHTRVGLHCDPKKLDLVITIGSDANNFSAPAAEANGCKVLRASSPYAIGELLKDKLKPDTIVLLKGSQNKVFLEEAIKPILEDKTDRSKLVRQSNAWLKLKKKQFANL